MGHRTPFLLSHKNVFDNHKFYVLNPFISLCFNLLIISLLQFAFICLLPLKKNSFMEKLEHFAVVWPQNRSAQDQVLSFMAQNVTWKNTCALEPLPPVLL